MNDFSDYLNSYNFVCNKIDSNDFSYNPSIRIPINDYEDEFHNKLAAYKICERINLSYSLAKIHARMSKYDYSTIVVYKEKPNFKSIFNKIFGNDKTGKNTAA